ncbi:MAG: TonB-dependent receptor [Gammaproteobacteria bacterium]|nr:TonB-dependent receptor [Gammaproteobacteria bacterium]
MIPRLSRLCVYPLLQPRDDGQRNSPGHALVNLQLRAKDVLPNTDLRLRIDNVFDRRWYKAADGNSTTFLAQAQDRRQISLMLDLRF